MVLKMSTRIHKLIFLIEFNINNELVVSKVKREEDEFWYDFEEEHQKIDDHSLIASRVRNIKFKKNESTKSLEHFFTEKELLIYYSNNEFKFKNTPLSIDDKRSIKRMKKDSLDYRSLNYIDFLNKFHKETANMAPSNKFLKLEGLLDESSLLNMVRGDKLTKSWTVFIEEFEERVNLLHINYIQENESKKFKIPDKLENFTRKYFEFCQAAYPKSSFRDNLSRFIIKLPKKYRPFFLKIKVNGFDEFYNTIVTPLSIMINNDYNQNVTKIGKTVRLGKDKTGTLPYTGKDKEDLINQSVANLELEDVAENIQDDIEAIIKCKK